MIQASVLNDSFESESDEEPLLDMGFGHAASFNEFRSSLPPIQVCCYLFSRNTGMLMYLQLGSIVLKLVHINMKIRTYGNIVVQITKIIIILFPFTFPFPFGSKGEKGAVF